VDSQGSWSTTSSAWVVVGHDGTEASRAAITWAAVEAAVSGAQVRVVVAWMPRVPQQGRRRSDPRDAVQLAEDGADAARRILGNPDRVRAQVQIGPAAEVLLNVSRESADLLVLGSRFDVLGGPGRVSRRCLMSGTVPIVTVGVDVAPVPERRIVTLCLNGACRTPAVEWAVRRAVRWGRPLHVLGSSRAGANGRSGAGADVVPRFAERDAMLLHGKAMREVGTAIAGRALLTGRLVHGPPLEVEASHSLPGDLLVLDADGEHLEADRVRPSCPQVWVPQRAPAPGGSGTERDLGRTSEPASLGAYRG
jgi:nucleotide-binding universal stress UspA family protein